MEEKDPYRWYLLVGNKFVLLGDLHLTYLLLFLFGVTMTWVDL